MKKDFQANPVQCVDLQDLYVIWRQADPTDCFNTSLTALQHQVYKKKGNEQNSKNMNYLKSYLATYDTPSLGFLMEVFKINDVKDSGSTNTDWRKRDLPQRMKIYAAKDAYYNLYIYQKLLQKVNIPYRGREFYNFRFFLHLLFCNQVGVDGVKRALNLSKKKLSATPKIRSFKPPVFIRDFVTEAILEWQNYLAKNKDFTPLQIINAQQITALSKWISEMGFNVQ